MHTSDRVLARGNAAPVMDGELEARIGIRTLDELQARLDEITPEWSVLWALYGSQGLFNDRRKTQLSIRALAIRNDVIAQGAKPTEAYLDTAAHADPDYIAFMDKSVDERIRFAVLDAERDAILAQMRRDDALIFSYGRESSRTGA